VRRREGAARHRSRELALQVLYALDLDRSPAGTGPDADEMFERVSAGFEAPAAARAFALELARGCHRERPSLDAFISRHTRNWRLERMAAVDRNILRLAAYELLHTETPAAVAIDEAVELARRFGGDASPGFVNGVADALARAAGTGGPAEARRGGAGA